MMRLLPVELARPLGLAFFVVLAIAAQPEGVAKKTLSKTDFVRPLHSCAHRCKYHHTSLLN